MFKGILCLFGSCGKFLIYTEENTQVLNMYEVPCWTETKQHWLECVIEIALGTGSLVAQKLIDFFSFALDSKKTFSRREKLAVIAPSMFKHFWLKVNARALYSLGKNLLSRLLPSSLANYFWFLSLALPAVCRGFHFEEGLAPFKVNLRVHIRNLW